MRGALGLRRLSSSPPLRSAAPLAALSPPSSASTHLPLLRSAAPLAAAPPSCSTRRGLVSTPPRRSDANFILQTKDHALLGGGRNELHYAVESE